MPRYQAAEREARYKKARAWGLPPVVTEGDSWFSYELYLNVVDRIDDMKRFALKRLESSGDTMAHMVGDTAGAAGIKALKFVIQNERPKFLFFSGGGNDIVGDEITGALRAFDPALKAKDYLDTKAWRDLLAGVKNSYLVLAEEIGPLCPIFAHGYDYFAPSNAKVKIFPGVPGPGPWVWPEMQRQGILDAKLQVAIARVLIDQFNDDVLGAVESEHPGFFGHIDLRGTLSLDEWQNEIHPTSKGFQKVADRFVALVEKKLPDLRTERAAVLQGAIS